MPKQTTKILFCIIFIAFTQASAYRIPDTGQTKCYDDDGNEINPCPKPGEPFYGQDANYSINPMSFTKLGSGMVKDNNTGLIWETKTDDGSIHDKDNQYTWQDTQDVFIAKLNREQYGGYSDWRLPDREELRSIVDYSISSPGPTINTEYFLNIMPGAYWSSSAYANSTDNAWFVLFYHGNDDSFNKLRSSIYVRAVRGGQSGSFDNLVIRPEKPIIAKKQLLPKVWFNTPSENYKTELSYVEVQVKAENIADTPDALTFFINDKPIKTEKKFVRPSLPDETVKTFTIQAPIIIGYNRIKVNARGKDGKTYTFPERTIIRKGQPLPALYYFGAGVSKHQNYVYSLRYPTKDVTELAETLKTQKGRAWSDVKTKILTDQEATRGNIIMEMNKFISNAKTDDLIIIFLSGHGKNEQSDYYFIAHDTQPDNIIANGLSWLKIINLLRKIPVKVLLLADTCYSGSVVGTDLIPKTDNLMVLSSSSGNTVSREDVSWGHGAFTLALIEGFSGKAFNKDGELKLYDLNEYVTKRVEKLTQGSQKPEIPNWSNFKEFNSLILGRK